jgi:Flp pilus assembly CpaF family ATPase
MTDSVVTIDGGAASSLDLTLRPLRGYLARPAVTELCINRPGELFLETDKGWEQVEASFADFDWCRRLARLIAHYTRQRIDEEAPLLSATLPSGERFDFHVDPFARHCMLEGVDQLGYLAKKEPEIAAFERARAGAC